VEVVAEVEEAVVDMAVAVRVWVSEVVAVAVAVTDVAVSEVVVSVAEVRVVLGPV